MAGGHPSLVMLMITCHGLYDHAKETRPSSRNTSSVSLQSQRQLVDPYIRNPKGNTLDLFLHSCKSLGQVKVTENSSPWSLPCWGSGRNSRTDCWTDGAHICMHT